MMRPFRLLFGLAMLATAFANPVSAKSADDYFHGASSFYVAGKIQEASVEVEEGLRLHPEDSRLRALGAQLKQMKDQQSGNDGKNDPKDDKKGDNKKNGKDKKTDDKKPGDPKNNPEDKNRKSKDGKNGDKQGQEDSDKNRDKNQDKQKPGEDPQNEDGTKDRNGSTAPKPGKMSEEDAKRLLNSFADDEKKEQGERRRILRQRAGTEQDW